MPPNPERQAKLAARRLAMENDPALQEAARDAGERVLGNYGKSPEVEAVKPRQMLPNYYRKGGPVTFAKGGSANFGNDYRKGK